MKMRTSLPRRSIPAETFDEQDAYQRLETLYRQEAWRFASAPFYAEGETEEEDAAYEYTLEQYAVHKRFVELFELITEGFAKEHGVTHEQLYEAVRTASTHSYHQRSVR